jgi:hypothetical protein
MDGWRGRRCKKAQRHRKRVRGKKMNESKANRGF